MPRTNAPNRNPKNVFMDGQLLRHKTCSNHFIEFKYDATSNQFVTYMGGFGEDRLCWFGGPTHRFNTMNALTVWHNRNFNGTSSTTNAWIVCQYRNQLTGEWESCKNVQLLPHIAAVVSWTQGNTSTSLPQPADGDLPTETNAVEEPDVVITNVITSEDRERMSREQAIDLTTVSSNTDVTPMLLSGDIISFIDSAEQQQIGYFQYYIEHRNTNYVVARSIHGDTFMLNPMSASISILQTTGLE